MRTRRLAMMLSGLEQLQSQSVELEQYTTDGDLAARWLADIAAFGDLSEDCTVVDLGAGNGVLGLGALAMGAGRAALVEADQAACDVAKSNAESIGFADSVEVIQATLGSDPVDLGSADVVISNPPWGRQTHRADRPFLEAMIDAAAPAHLLHSAEATHIQPLFENAGWSTERYGDADFALPAAYSHHSRQRGRTRAAFWRLTPP
jgi:predicted RNA methylase